jgi:hypothetical protein
MVINDDEDLDTNDPSNDIELTSGAQVADYDSATKEVKDISITIDSAGTYYCVVTNHVNGSEASTTSERIRVSPVS